MPDPIEEIKITEEPKVIVEPEFYDDDDTHQEEPHKEEPPIEEAEVVESRSSHYSNHIHRGNKQRLIAPVCYLILFKKNNSLKRLLYKM